MNTATHRLIRLLAVGALLAPCYALAVLGGAPTASTNAEQKNVLASSSKVAGASSAYSVQETVDTSGTRLREFIDNSGMVFALAWQGPRIPDLRTELGQYFGQMQAAPKAPHTARSNTLISNDNLVVQSGGRPRAYIGRAWLPAQLPAGVSTSDIQ